MAAHERLRLVDAARGFSVLSMVAFHWCYDLKFLVGASLPWFAPPLQDVWRSSISWAFLLIAGCMCSLSRSNLRRAARYGAVALAVFVATSLASVDVPISFGIIYCMAACTLVAWLLERLHVAPKGPRTALVLFVAFLVLRGLPLGYVGVGDAVVRLPLAWYQTPWLAWLGLPGPGFSSGDYYPLLPYLLLFLAGSAMGRWWKDKGFPKAFLTRGCVPLEHVGRLALPVYVAHQPLLLLLCGLIG